MALSRCSGFIAHTKIEREVANMDQLSAPLQFLEDAQTIPKISARVLLAVERGGPVTADEVMQIAQEFGYSFTREAFQQEVRRSMAERFAVGDMNVINVEEAETLPESSYAHGCLSYSVNWHPFILGSPNTSVGAVGAAVDRQHVVPA